MRWTVLSVGVIAALATSAFGFAAFHGASGEARLAVRDGSNWVTWWRHDTRPMRWDSKAPLVDRITWRRAASGLEWGELQLRGVSEAWRTRVIVVRLDPRTVDLSLVPAFIGNESWSIGKADSNTVLALDAGQFRGSLPYGWVVTHARELLAPEYAPLAGAVVVDTSGSVRVVSPEHVAAERTAGTAREAFQSYPMLLQDGVVPLALRESGHGVNLEHRDARLALGTLDDGRVVVALTRFDALGESLGRLPFGLTTPEMAAVMGGLGARQALLLDGGLSGQLMVRDAEGAAHSWPGSRGVPLGLVAHGKPR